VSTTELIINIWSYDSAEKTTKCVLPHACLRAPKRKSYWQQSA